MISEYGILIYGIYIYMVIYFWIFSGISIFLAVLSLYFPENYILLGYHGNSLLVINNSTG